jgi:hypothetical protein
MQVAAMFRVLGSTVLERGSGTKRYEPWIDVWDARWNDVPRYTGSSKAMKTGKLICILCFNGMMASGSRRSKAADSGDGGCTYS